VNASLASAERTRAANSAFSNLTASSSCSRATRLISRLLHSLTEQVRAARARGETLDQVKASVKLDEFERAFAGDSQLRRILFSYYVTTPAIQRAYELNGTR